MERGSAIRRLLRRVRNAWENGSVWVAFVIGLAMGPQLQGIVFVLAIIMASGTAFGIDQRRNRVRLRDTGGRGDHSRQQFGHASENPSVPVTAARLGAGSPTEARGSHLRTGWGLADGPGHGRAESRSELRQ